MGFKARSKPSRTTTAAKARTTKATKASRGRAKRAAAKPAARSARGGRVGRAAPVYPGNERMRELLEDNRGNVSAVARELRVPRLQVARWLEDNRIDAGTYRAITAKDVRKALREHDGNATNAMRAMGLSRTHFYRKLHDLGIDPTRFRRPSEPPKPIPVPRPANGTWAPGALRKLVLGRLKLHKGNVSAIARDFSVAPVQVRRWCRYFGVRAADYR